ncbi:ankyrin repeat domain-containing protein, partial [Thermus sp.]|uniref:ankyrin repeat domain-containing protein n=1 Tax=Thermus sp. TaxID=275 RepID=UPI003329D986
MTTLMLAGLALANPLLEEKFWKTATPADVEQAIQQGAKVDARDKDDQTPLHLAAAFSQSPEVLSVLVAAIKESAFFFRVDTTDRTGRTPLHLAAANNPNPKVLEALLELGANLEATDENGWTPLHFAAAFNPNPE